MNRFFVPNKIYKERISTCKKCKFYFKLTGQCKKCLCFMKVKARLAPMECPEKYWLKTKEMKAPEDLPKEIINEVLLIWEDIKTGKAKNHEVKAKMIELYNTIYGSNYSTGTNCGSCLSTCFDGIQKLYKKYKPKDQFYEV
jgi:NAD-dependent dihydropyrimidine dehydrogenase PreA subunit